MNHGGSTTPINNHNHNHNQTIKMMMKEEMSSIFNYCVNHGRRSTIRDVLACEFLLWYPLILNVVSGAQQVSDEDNGNEDDDDNDNVRYDDPENDEHQQQEQEQDPVTPLRMTWRPTRTIQSVIVQDVFTRNTHFFR